MLTAKN